MGTVAMSFLAIGIIVLALFYQKKMNEVKKNESLLRLRAVLNKEQEERKRMAEDLHDTVSGNLSSVNIYFSLIKNRTSEPEILEIIGNASRELRDTQEEIRRISYNLMPPILVTSGFIPSLEEYLNKSSIRNGFHYELRDDGFKEMSQESSYQLLQILQEFVTNSSRHGKSRNVKVTVGTKEHTEIYYSDDGEIYDFYNEINNPRGYGLKNILSRIETINGRLQQLPSEVGNHFKITVKYEN